MPHPPTPFDSFCCRCSPAIFAAVMIVFAISIDDFVISAFLQAVADSQTVPVLIYSNARAAPNPSLNAIATLMLLCSLTAVALACSPSAGCGVKSAGGAVEDFARMDI